MPSDFTGRSAILKHEIERLEHEHELLCREIAKPHGPEAIHCTHDSSLTDLGEELKRELSAQRVVVFGTAHGLQVKGDARNSELQSRLLYLVGKFDATITMEEWAPDCPPSLASTLANDRVAYQNVGTPAEDEFRTFCNAPINHPAHDGTFRPLRGCASILRIWSPRHARESRKANGAEHSGDNEESSCRLVCCRSGARSCNFCEAKRGWLQCGRIHLDR